jgi:hypothetical protein
MGQGNNLIQSIRKDAEKNVATQIKQHMDDIAAPLYAMLNLTEEQYQKLVNAMSWEYCHDAEKMVRIRFCEGRTKMPRFMSIHGIRASTKNFMEANGLIHGDNTAYVDPETVLIQRLEKLVEEGIVHLTPNMIFNIQVLGDATGIWRSMKVNGTTVILKPMYSETKGTKRKGCGANSKENQIPIGFYLGEDSLVDMRKYLSHLPDALKKIQTNGIEVNGVRVEIKLWLGGDLKFLTSMLGMAGNQTIHPCPFCLAENSKTCRQVPHALP